jgi:hypothetical protein
LSLTPDHLVCERGDVSGHYQDGKTHKHAHLSRRRGRRQKSNVRFFTFTVKNIKINNVIIKFGRDLNLGLKIRGILMHIMMYK